MSTLKRGHFKRKIVKRNHYFSGAMLVFGGMGCLFLGGGGEKSQLYTVSKFWFRKVGETFCLKHCVFFPANFKGGEGEGDFPVWVGKRTV